MGTKRSEAEQYRMLIAVLNYIIRYQEANGRGPTLLNIMAEFKIASITARKRVRKMINLGWVKRWRNSRIWYQINDPRGTNVWATSDDRIRIDYLPKYMSRNEALDLAETIKAVALSLQRKVATVKRRMDDG